MLDKRLTIFAPDFKPKRGGVAEYAYQLALGLSKAGCLDRVVTTVAQNEHGKYGFVVTEAGEGYGRKWGERRGDSVPVLRKANSFVCLCRDLFFWYRELLNLLRNREHAHVLFTSLYGRPIRLVLSACLKLGIRFSVVFHGLDLIRIAQRNPSYLDDVCTGADVVVFNSEATRALFGRLHTALPQTSYVLHPGINPAQLDAAQRVSCRELERKFDVDMQGKTVFLSLARLVERKGIDIALRALAPLLDTSDSCRYIIAGDGPEYNALKAQVEALGLCDKVRLTGAVTDAEKYGLLEAASIFVMPNHTRSGKDFEGFGISFVEASYFENVVIGGRSGGAVEAVAEGKSGFLLDVDREGAEERLRALAARLLDDPNRVAELSKQGRQYVLEHFQVSRLVADFAHWLRRTKGMSAPFEE